jgi:hypothetical protein
LVVGEEDKRMKIWSSSHLNFHLSTQTIGLKLVNHMSVKNCPGFGSVPREHHAIYGPLKGWWALQKCNYVFEELTIISNPVIPGRYLAGITGIFYLKKEGTCDFYAM